MKNFYHQNYVSSAAHCGVDGAPPLTIEQCRRLDAALRCRLELLDQEIRVVCNRMIADVHASGGDSVMFVNASATVLMSIAANLAAMGCERTHEDFDEASFLDCAENAARWVKHKRNDLRR